MPSASELARLDAEREDLTPTRTKIWSCRIGEVLELPPGADMPMRQAVSDAYQKITGWQPDFIFSGWGGELSEGERAVVENRPIAIAEREEETTIADTIIDGLQTRAKRLGFNSIGEALDHIENGGPHEGEIRITVEDAHGLCLRYTVGEDMLEKTYQPSNWLGTHAGIAVDRFMAARETGR